MGHIPLLDELTLVAVLGVAVTLLLARFELPAVAGLLAVGALVGPFGLGLVRSVHAIEVLAEIGVVLLLFTIGLEFSLARLRDVFRKVALGGALQVGLTTLVVAGVAMALGQGPRRGVFYGFVFALSSTAIVLRALTERRELDAPHGRFIVGTLVFQDLCVIPMVLVIPLLASSAPASQALVGVAFALGKAALVVVGTIVVAGLVVPKIFAWVDASRSREAFLLTVLGLCIGTAWLTSLAGLSLALGAFLGGMIVAGTEHRHRALGEILPLRDAFLCVFFVSLGMLFDARVVLRSPLLVALLLFGFVVGKGVLATIAALAMRFPARVAWLSGVGLAQFGEFGFVTTRLAQHHGVIDDAAAGPLLAAGILSMFVTPLLTRWAPHFTAGERILAPLERLLGVRGIDDAARPEGLRGHVVLVGFGVAGRLAARALVDAGLPIVVLELNAANVRAGRELGLPVFYADATSEEALRHADVEHAREVVLLMNDPAASFRVIDCVRRVAPGVPLLVRTRYQADRPALAALGIERVVVEETEGALDVVRRVLETAAVPRSGVVREVARVRQEMIEQGGF